MAKVTKTALVALAAALVVAALVVALALRKEGLNFSWLGKAGSKAKGSAAAATGTGAKTAGAARGSRASPSIVQRVQANADAVAAAKAGRAQAAKVPKPPPRKRAPIQRAKTQAAKAVASGARAVVSGAKAANLAAMRAIEAVGKATGQAAIAAARRADRLVRASVIVRGPRDLAREVRLMQQRRAEVWRVGDEFEGEVGTTDASLSSFGSDVFSPFYRDLPPYVALPRTINTADDVQAVLNRVALTNPLQVPGNSGLLANYRKYALINAWAYARAATVGTPEWQTAINYARELTTNRALLTQKARDLYVETAAAAP